MSTGRQQKGFTLLEIMVVVFIIAIFAGLSVFALQLASRRPYQAEAERFHSWLQDISERARLEGFAYGLIQSERQVRPLVFYRHHWFPLETPEPFVLSEQAQIILTAEQSTDTESDNALKQEGWLPVVVLDGNSVEPNAAMILYFEDEALAFAYQWDTEASSVAFSSYDGQLP